MCRPIAWRALQSVIRFDAIEFATGPRAVAIDVAEFVMMIESIRNVLPLWAVALMVAAAAPWLVRALAESLEARARKRALVVVVRADERRRSKRT